MVSLKERIDEVTGEKHIDIYVTRGDTLPLKIEPKHNSGEPYELDAQDEVRFALKKSYRDEECLILQTIPTQTMILNVSSEDTKKLSVDRKGYVYDIQLTDKDGIVSTFMSGILYTTEEVE